MTTLALALLWLLPLADAPPSAPPEPVEPTAPLAPVPARAQESSNGGNDNTHRFSPVALPVVNINVDEGFGGGVVAALYHRHGGVKPYRDDMSVRLFITSRLVQRHELRWEGLETFDLPLRVWTRVGFFSTVTQNFCGYGNGVSCDPERAQAQALALGLDPGSTAATDFARRYYLMRYIRPHGDALVRYRLSGKPMKLELMGGARFAAYIPGDFYERTPYPGSLYASLFPQGEPGFSSVLQLGVTLDTRDREPVATRGYFFESSVRGASPLWGSKWSYAGFNSALAGYVRLWRSPQLVLAQRVLVDLLAGDVPTEEQAQTGGTRDHAAFGGQWMGRGIRDHRYIGKIKLIDQSELRVDAWSWTIFGQKIDMGFGVFCDLAWIGADWNDFAGGVPRARGPAFDRGSLQRILFSGGGGIRFLFNDAISMRFDLAASPFERQAPGFYTPVGYPF